MFKLHLHLVTVDVAKRSKRQKFVYILCQTEATANTMADRSNYNITITYYLLASFSHRMKATAERSTIISQSRMTFFISQPMNICVILTFTCCCL